MPEQYFVALKHLLTAYVKETALTILEQVGSRYSTMDTRSKKKLKAKYYQPWDVGGGKLVSQFTQDLETKRVELAFHGVNIVESNLVEHFIEQMYHSKAFKDQHEGMGSKRRRRQRLLSGLFSLIILIKLPQHHWMHATVL